MAYIRQNQPSDYIDALDQSRAYIYDNGNGIVGVGSYGEFIHAMCAHAKEAGFEQAFVTTFQELLEDHYTEKRDFDAVHIGPAPEMAHIIAQHLDSRLDSFEYTDEAAEMLNDYAAEQYIDCPECGTTHRPASLGQDHGDLCRDCYVEALKESDVSADVSELRQYVDDELPERVPPDEFHDDEFYALASEVWMEAEGRRREALHHIIAEGAADEILDAVAEERPVDKEKLHSLLDKVSE